MSSIYTTISKPFSFGDASPEFTTVTRTHTYTSTTKTIVYDDHFGNNSHSSTWTWTSNSPTMANGYSPHLGRYPIGKIAGFHQKPNGIVFGNHYKSAPDFQLYKSMSSTPTNLCGNLYQKYHLISSAMILSKGVSVGCR